MADFKTSLDKTLVHEGGWANDPDDTGGQTWRGVSRKNNPEWPGWVIIDSYKSSASFPKILAQDAELQAEVEEIYLEKYWSPLRIDQINDQLIADKLFDMSVNMGPKTAAKLLQTTIGVSVDGAIGPKTLAVINAADPTDLLRDFIMVIIARYMHLCKKKRVYQKYLYGWIRRAMA